MQIRLIYGPHHKGQHTGKTFVQQGRPKISGQMVLKLGQFDLTPMYISSLWETVWF